MFPFKFFQRIVRRPLLSVCVSTALIYVFSRTRALQCYHHLKRTFKYFGRSRLNTCCYKIIFKFWPSDVIVIVIATIKRWNNRNRNRKLIAWVRICNRSRRNRYNRTISDFLYQDIRTVLVSKSHSLYIKSNPWNKDGMALMCIYSCDILKYLNAGCRTVSNNGTGSGLAPAQNILAVQVWLRFTWAPFSRFRFGSGSLK